MAKNFKENPTLEIQAEDVPLETNTHEVVSDSRITKQVRAYSRCKSPFTQRIAHQCLKKTVQQFRIIERKILRKIHLSELKQNPKTDIYGGRVRRSLKKRLN
jgi:hypothetical protein